MRRSASGGSAGVKIWRRRNQRRRVSSASRARLKLATLLPLMEDSSESERPKTRPHTFLYPDPPIALHEKELIRRYDSKINVLTPIEYINGAARRARTSPKPQIVSASISDSPNVAELGFEHAHLDRLWVTLNRHLLALGFGGADGGDLRGGGFTEILLDLVCAYADEGRALTERIVHWFVAWPIHLKIDNSVEAELSNVVKLHRVNKPDDVGCDPKRFVGADADPCAWIRSLTEMREEMVRKTQGRVLVGGQRRASTPRSGIAEEFVLSLKDNQPIFLCGGFGGMAADLAQVLQGGPAPESLTQAYHADSEERQKTIDFYNQSEAGKRDSIDYAAWVQLIQDKGVSGLKNGLTPEENQRLFTSHSVDDIVGLIRKGLLKTGL